jgi:hypothetical protein
MLYQRRMQGQACGVGHCKEIGLTSWMWEVVESEKSRHGSQATLSLSSECVCKPRWSRNGEAHPAANLMLFVPAWYDRCNFRHCSKKIKEIYRIQMMKGLRTTLQPPGSDV